MPTSQFYSICLAQESIRACRAFLLGSPYPSRSVLQTPATAALSLKLRLPRLSFGGSSVCGLGFNGPSPLLCRTFSAGGSPLRSRKSAETYNPRDEIRKLDEEIHRLERERRSVGKGKNSGSQSAGRKALFGGRKENAGISAVKGPVNAKPPPSNRSKKLAASLGSSRNANARTMARFTQEEEEDDEDDDEDEEDYIADEDDKELGDDFSSDTEMYMETTDAEKENETEASCPSSLTDENMKLSTVTKENPALDAAVVSAATSEIPVESSAEGGLTEELPAEEALGTKHPWKEWNDFFDVLSQKNYFKDVPPSKFSLAGEGYLSFQSSSHMKRGILEFSRERDDIIRFLTKKHIRTVVNVGCPSTDRKVVNACKRLRVLCEIPEDEVCQQCKLKTFCTRAFAAPSPDLVAETADVARVLYSFALNASPNAESQVSYPVTVVKSACHLINEIVQLSAYPKDPALPPLKSRIPVKQPVVEQDEEDTNHRPGDWTCPDCNFLNFSKNRECRECGTFRESARKLEPGDWECQECTFVNFRRNKECRECLSPRPPGVGEPSDGRGDKMMPGDWKCPECQFVNFRRNFTCRKCSSKRPKDMEPQDAEDYKLGDWKCPECSFRNFQRNKNCRECGTLSPEQERKDDRWGLKKTSAESGGWGSRKSLQMSDAESDQTSSGRLKFQEWKPDLDKAIADADTDDDLEENADVVFSRGDGEEDSPRPKGSKTRRNAADEGSLSDFDFSDLDDHPKRTQKKRGSKNAFENKDEDEDDEDDDDNDMLDELSEEEEFTSTAAAKENPAKSSRFSRKWDISASDEDDDDDDLSDKPLASKAASRRTPAKGKALSRKWDDSDDEDDGFNDDDDDFGRSRGRGRSSRGGQRGRDFGWDRGQRGRDFGGDRGQRGGAFGSYRGSQRSGSFGGSRGAERGESYGLGGRGGRTSRFLDSSDEDEEEFGRKGGGRRGRGGFLSGGGRQSSRFSESSDDDDEGFSRGYGRRGRGTFGVGGGGRGRDGGFSRGGGRGGSQRSEFFSGGGGRDRFENGGSFSRSGGRGGFESGRGRGGGGSRGRGRGSGRRGRS